MLIKLFVMDQGKLYLLKEQSGGDRSWSCGNVKHGMFLIDAGAYADLWCVR